ncbi:hypothetical protein BSR29_05800 [Boudabousia liubingyangii]|uniref:Sec-independent protein translocase protein TatA n=1 Tax=Boudabousia liubingyangii TaxID=1921764 RepID=A0A1Q5PLQ9_9ACTO|nr:twin-arginine translocase TatA/TatE family subunit [Boudabousia liubingyangii]OKL47991.1 hypothetical protein BSR29_05800 [Boudabousia liubingyangii]
MRPSHIFILLLIALIIFGAPKLPEVARSIGQSLKILKKEVRELSDDDNNASVTSANDTAGTSGGAA